MKLEENKDSQEPVVIGHKMLHKGALIGHVSNGGGIIDLGNGKALKFTALNDKFTMIYVLEYGIGQKVQTQSWQKSKVVNKTIIKEKIVKVKPKQEQLVFEENDTTKVLF